MDTYISVNGWWDSDLLSLTFDGSINEYRILDGYEGYSQGVKYKGAMPNNSFPTKPTYTSAMAVKADGVGSLCVAPQTGYYSPVTNEAGFGQILVNDPNFVPTNIPIGKSMFGLAGTNTNKKWKYGHTSSLSATTFTANNLGFTPACIVIKCFTTVNSNAYEITAVYNSGIYQPIATYARINTPTYAPEGNYGSYVAKIPIWSVSAGTFSFSVSGYTFSEVDYWAYE